MPVPHLTFMVPGRYWNASCCSSLSLDVGGWALWATETLCCFWFSWTCSRRVCCFSSSVESLLISLDWALISSACLRCKWDRTDTWVWCAISSSTISTSNSSFPFRAWASVESFRSEALLWESSYCSPWALVTLWPIPSSISLSAKAWRVLFISGLNSFSVFILAYYKTAIQEQSNLPWHFFLTNSIKWFRMIWWEPYHEQRLNEVPVSWHKKLMENEELQINSC